MRPMNGSGELIKMSDMPSAAMHQATRIATNRPTAHIDPDNLAHGDTEFTKKERHAEVQETSHSAGGRKNTILFPP